MEATVLLKDFRTELVSYDRLLKHSLACSFHTMSSVVQSFEFRNIV